jgi:shikimate 5-dehydrogenase
MCAEDAGLKAISGLGMLVRQAEGTFKIWTGADPKPGVMRRAAEVMLAATG